MQNVRDDVPLSRISARFHVTLAEMIVAVAQRAAQRCVVLTGGCFQNRFLTEQAVLRLEAAGFETFRHQRIPPNDGGIAFGQAAAVAWSPGYDEK
jgi:hydrogenase maturation protein HypF